MAVQIISIVGKTKSGKTTLIEKLIPALEQRGVRVGTIKHDVHRFDMDRPGKDTYRHFKAGARAVLIASPDKLALQKRLSAQVTLDELAGQYMDDVDLVLTEGYKSEDKPKIEVFRKQEHDAPLCGPGDNLAAVVTDDDVDVDCPVFGLDDVVAVAEFIINNYMQNLS